MCGGGKRKSVSHDASLPPCVIKEELHVCGSSGSVQCVLGGAVR